MIIAVDFDGTCTTHDYPKIGKDIGAVPVLKKLVEKGHQLIVWTMRCDNKEDSKGYATTFTEAVKWFEENEIPLWGKNCNPTQNWSKSPKAYAQIYIDDAALGTPLKWDPTISDRPFVDWQKVEQLLIEQEVL